MDNPVEHSSLVLSPIDTLYSLRLARRCAKAVHEHYTEKTILLENGRYRSIDSWNVSLFTMSMRQGRMMANFSDIYCCITKPCAKDEAHSSLELNKACLLVRGVGW